MSAMVKKYSHLIERIETGVFYVMCFLGVWSFFDQPNFLSADGAAHVYNAHIINDLLFNSDSIFDGVFQFNSLIVPNWIGHGILCIFLPLFGGILAEKTLLALTVVITPIAGRIFLQKTGKNVLASYFFILFSHHALLYLGFYNFTLGLPIMLATLVWSVEGLKSKRRSSYAWLALWYLLLYFSHLFFLLATMGFQVVLLFHMNSGKSLKEIKQRLRKFLGMIISASPSLIMAVMFLNKTTSNFVEFSYGFEKLRNILLELQPLHPGFTVTPSLVFESFEQSIWTLIGLMLGFGLVWQIQHRKNKMSWTNFWFLGLLIVTVLFFVVPDARLYMTERIFILLLTILTIWLGSFQVHKLAYPIIILLAFFIQREMHFSAMSFHSNNQIHVTKVLEMQNYLPKRANLLTFNYSDYWLAAGHGHNYLGLKKGVVDLNNYECTLNHFPLRYSGPAHSLLQAMTDSKEITKPLTVENWIDGDIIANCVLLIKDNSSEQKHKEKKEFLLSRGYRIENSNVIADLFIYPYK